MSTELERENEREQGCTREQFMLAHCIAGMIQAVNPPFCDEVATTTYRMAVAKKVAVFINGDALAVEDAIDLLHDVHRAIVELGIGRESGVQS